MLEILLLVRLCKSLAALAKEKGRAGGWAGLGVLFWFTGEVMGFVVGEALDLGLGAYGIALAFAGIGAAVSYAVVKGLSPAAGVEAELSGG